MKNSAWRARNKTWALVPAPEAACWGHLPQLQSVAGRVCGFQASAWGPGAVLPQAQPPSLIEGQMRKDTSTVVCVHTSFHSSQLKKGLR